MHCACPPRLLQMPQRLRPARADLRVALGLPESLSPVRGPGGRCHCGAWVCVVLSGFCCACCSVELSSGGRRAEVGRAGASGSSVRCIRVLGALRGGGLQKKLRKALPMNQAEKKLWDMAKRVRGARARRGGCARGAESKHASVHVCCVVSVLICERDHQGELHRLLHDSSTPTRRDLAVTRRKERRRAVALPPAAQLRLAARVAEKAQQVRVRIPCVFRGFSALQGRGKGESPGAPADLESLEYLIRGAWYLWGTGSLVVLGPTNLKTGRCRGRR